MSFEPKKYQQISDEMRAKSQVVTDFEVGSVARTMYDSFSFELALLYEKMRLVYLAGYVDTAQGRDLENVVAVLGLKRGLPDYASGVVTFFRDKGNDDILIPIGTLVATEDSQENPKKTYQTLEEKTLTGTSQEVEVKIRAVNRGESEVTERETISVMPRPIPGIKSVINSADILFTGKGEETDVEFRERAKNALISAGKASKISLENALLSLPGVRDARINERFNYARGMITLSHGTNVVEVAIPRGTKFIVTVGPTQIVYRSLYLAVLADSTTNIELEIEAEEIGAKGEVPDITAVTNWAIISDEFGPNDLVVNTLLSDEPLVQKDFGVIEVFVDGPDLKDPNEFAKISDEIDRVKAAGIYAIIKGVQEVIMQGIFRIELPVSLSLSDIERLELEAEVADVIKDFIGDLNMGTALRFTQLISAVIGLEQVDNMDEFIIEINKPYRDDLIFPPFELLHKKIELEEAERFDLEESTIFVASENKPLPIKLEFKVNPGALSDDFVRETSGLKGYIEGFPLGTSINQTEIEAGITSLKVPPDNLVDLFPGFVPASLRIIPQPIFEREVLELDNGVLTVVPSFVEYVTLGALFAYENYLDIIGAIPFSLVDPSVSPAERADIIENMHLEIDSFLNEFGSAEKIPLDTLKSRLEALEEINEVTLEEEDFQVEILGTATDDRFNEWELDVKQKEKARKHHLCISDKVETVDVVISNLVLTMKSTMPPLTQLEKDQAVTERVNLANTFMSAAPAGQNVDLNNLILLLESPSQGYSIELDTITLTATSNCPEDQDATNAPRIQTLTQVEANDRQIHIRSNEQAVITTISPADITLNHD